MAKMDGYNHSKEQGSEPNDQHEVLGAVKYMQLKGYLQPVRRPDGQIGYGLTSQARAMLKDINRESGEGHANTDR